MVIHDDKGNAVTEFPTVGGSRVVPVKVQSMPAVSIDTTGLSTSTIQTDGSQKSQIVDSGGEVVTVTGGKLDVNATINTAGLATTTTDTNTGTIAGDTTSIDSKTPALGQALAAASVPVILPSATITTLTPPAAITGFATSAKQDTLLTELQLKADLTETQPVSLASVPSHAVTNAGTFAVQVTSAPTTAVTGTFYQATQPISGSVTATQATGTNLHVVVDTAPTTAVTGTFYQATQPVSIATMPSTPVTGTFWQVTQPVSGTVTANLSATDNTVLDNIDTSTASHYITGVGHGVKVVTTAGTDVALAASTPCKRVTIQAQLDNTSTIAVGATGVDATVATGTGIVLNPGDVFEFDIDNLADVFIDSLVNGEGVRFQYLT